MESSGKNAISQNTKVNEPAAAILNTSFSFSLDLIKPYVYSNVDPPVAATNLRN